MIKAFYKAREWAPWAYGGGALLIVPLAAGTNDSRA